jgi:hypothetical protein
VVRPVRVVVEVLMVAAQEVAQEVGLEVGLEVAQEVEQEVEQEGLRATSFPIWAAPYLAQVAHWVRQAIP